MEAQICKERETGKSLKRDLEEATRTLNLINQNAVILSRELELQILGFTALKTRKMHSTNLLIDKNKFVKKWEKTWKTHIN